MNNAKQLFLAWAIVAMTAAGCANPSSPEEQGGAGSGSAAVSVRASELSAADVARLEVTVSGEGITTDITVTLPEGPEDEWSGTVPGIPAGTDRTFAAAAYDASNALIYWGEATGVTIEDGVTASVTIYLQQVDPPEPFANAVPVITSFVVSPMVVNAGDDVTLVVEATDPDPGDTLTYQWAAPGGVFSDSTSPSTIWTAPELPGLDFPVVILVSDPHGSTASLTATVTIVAEGQAAITVVINSSPEVLGLHASRSRIDEGESTTLALDVVDADADPLAFEWSADCDGAFDDNTLEDPTFTLTTLTGDTCTLSVVVTDGNEGSNQASLTIQTAPPLLPNDLPEMCNGAIVFPDANLEAEVRERIGMPTGDIYYGDVFDLTRLHAVSVGISDLTGSQCLNNLTILELSYNSVSDVSPLAGLTSLNHLYLHDNSISDVSPLAGLNNLTSLYLYDNSISDVSPLAGLTSLAVLYLYNNSISDVSPLAGLTSLAELTLNDNSISDVSPLAGLTSLWVLYLHNNSISDVSPLAGLTSLAELTLNDNSISDVSPLAGLTSLSYLNLHNNSISDLQPLVANEEFDPDYLYLTSNPLNCADPGTQEDIAILEARVWNFTHDCE